MVSSRYCVCVCARVALLKANLQRSQRRSCASRSELSRCLQEAYLHLQCQRWGQTDNSSQLLTFYFCKHLFIFFINLVTPIVGQRVALDRVWHIVEKIWINKSVSWVEIGGGGGRVNPVVPPSAACWFTSPSRQSASENEVIPQPPARRKCSQSAWVLTQNLILIKWLMSHGINANDFLKQTSINH